MKTSSSFHESKVSPVDVKYLIDILTACRTDCMYCIHVHPKKQESSCTGTKIQHE